MTAVSGTVVFEDEQRAVEAEVIVLDRDAEEIDLELTTGSDGSFSDTASGDSLHILIEHEVNGQLYNARSAYDLEDYEGLEFTLEEYTPPPYDDFTLVLGPLVTVVGVHHGWVGGEAVEIPLVELEDVEDEAISPRLVASNGETGYLYPDDDPGEQYLGFFDVDGNFHAAVHDEDDI